MLRPLEDDEQSFPVNGSGQQTNGHDKTIISLDGSPYPRKLKPFTLEDFLRLDLPQRELILSPILPMQGLGMIHAQRGVGKTYVGLGAAYAAASGGQFLKWKAETPIKVLYIDGEMAASSMQDRMTSLVEQVQRELPDPDYFRILTPDLYADHSLPDVSTREGQAAIDTILDDARLVVLDNLSCLCRTGSENDAESWQPIQDWLLRLRRQGRSVLLVHHQGKGGKQRGSSRREDILDVVIALRRPGDYQPNEGARFEVHIEKGRHIVGEDAEPFEATLGNGGWSFRTLDNAREIAILRLAEDGLTNQREIASELGLGLGTVNRCIKKLKAAGTWPGGDK